MNDNLAELDYRESNGISVTLLWARITGDVLVRVVDEGSDDDFTLRCAPGEARAVFDHPFAYAATRPVHRHRRTVAG